MSKPKKILFIILVTYVIYVIAAVIWSNRNVNSELKYDEQGVKMAIEGFMPNGDFKNKVEIKKILPIDNTLQVLFTKEGTLAASELTKGFFNNYKVAYVGLGTLYIYTIRETNKGKYLIIRGKNHDPKIHHIEAVVAGIRYKFDIPREEYFILYSLIPKEFNSPFPDEHGLYDKNNNNITYEIYKKYDN